MKKLLAGIFAVALVLNLAACGGGGSGSAGSGPAAGAAVNTETTAVQSDVKEAKDAKDASENVSTDDGAAAGRGNDHAKGQGTFAHDPGRTAAGAPCSRAPCRTMRDHSLRTGMTRNPVSLPYLL